MSNVTLVLLVEMNQSAVALRLTALHTRETRETSLLVKFPYRYGNLLVLLFL